MRDCHVRRLAIQAPDASTAARGALLVEDALRTASLPGESSRLLIVRELHIGAIPARANATAVSRRIEAALAQLPGQAVAAGDPSAAAAPAVYFADEVEACVQLAVLGARGQAPDAWFWSRAVEGWRSGYGSADAVRCALGAAARRQNDPDAAAHAVRRVLVGLLAAGVIDAALAALEPEDGPLLYATESRLGLRGSSPPATRAGTAASLVEQHSNVPQTVALPGPLRLARWAATWGAGDARTLWLAAALPAVEAGDRRSQARAGDDALARQAGAWAAELNETKLRRVQPTHNPAAREAVPTTAQRSEIGAETPSAPQASPSPGAQASPPARASQPAESAPRAAVPPALSVQLPPPEAQAPLPAGAPPKTPPPEAQASSPAEPLVWWRGLPLQPTTAAGLWFLLPVLARLDIKTWLQEHSGADDLPWRVLAELARRAAAPPLDPVWSVLRHGSVLDYEDRTGMRFGGDGPAVATSAVPAEPHAPTRNLEQPVSAWCDRVQAWCAALPDVGESEERLTAIVRRRGWLYTTPTHIDVFFDLAQADLRIRRLGLDIDPGWLPWLRRVVTFYYETGLAEQNRVPDET